MFVIINQEKFWLNSNFNINIAELCVSTIAVSDLLLGWIK